MQKAQVVNQWLRHRQTQSLWYNNCLVSFSCDVLCWLSVLALVLSKDDCKISVSFEQVQNFEVSNLAIVKVKKSQYCSYLLRYTHLNKLQVREKSNVTDRHQSRQEEINTDRQTVRKKER